MEDERKTTVNATGRSIGWYIHDWGTQEALPLLTIQAMQRLRDEAIAQGIDDPRIYSGNL